MTAQIITENIYVKKLLASGKKEVSLEELNDILQIEHGKHLASIISKEIEISWQKSIVKQHAKEHGKSLALLVEIESQKLELEQLNLQLSQLNKIAHKAGMADVAADILHNVGNILNSIMTSTNLTLDVLKESKLNKLFKANSMLRENIGRLDDFITKDPNGHKLMNYYLKLEDVLVEENRLLVKHTQRLNENIKMLTDVIATQQNYISQNAIMAESVNLKILVEDVLTMNADSIKYSDIKVKRDVKDAPTVMAQKAKLIQILFQLLANAKEAMTENDPQNRYLLVSLYEENASAYVRIKDSGCGIAPENLARIFNYGFSTNSQGRGFGLHNCANYMTEMGGRLWAESDGLGKGATFILQVPVKHKNSA